MNDHPDYKKGIENGANLLAKEIDRLCMEAIRKSGKVIDKGRFVGKDPVRHCAVYKEIGCSHVDGYLCNMSDCSILRDYKK
jgi:hypothetical protein